MTFLTENSNIFFIAIITLQILAILFSIYYAKKSSRLESKAFNAYFLCIISGLILKKGELLTRKILDKEQTKKIFIRGFKKRQNPEKTVNEILICCGD